MKKSKLAKSAKFGANSLPTIVRVVVKGAFVTLARVKTIAGALILKNVTSPTLPKLIYVCVDAASLPFQ